MQHVYSHVGDPWNELADAGAAAYSLRRLRSTVKLPDLLAQPSLRCLMPWAFLHLLEESDRAQYPPFIADGRMKATMDVEEMVGLPACKIAARIDVAVRADGNTIPVAATVAVPLLFITFNPQTLRPMCKRDSFAMQFGTMRAHAIGFQEARFLHTELKSIPDTPYIQATSACTSQGSGGCAMWINTAIPWTSSVGSAPTLNDIAIMYATPRLLVCQITAADVVCDCVVMHASDQEQEDWWGNLSIELAPHLRSGIPRIFLVDANTSFANESMGVIGGAAHGVQ